MASLILPNHHPIQVNAFNLNNRNINKNRIVANGVVFPGDTVRSSTEVNTNHGNQGNTRQQQSSPGTTEAKGTDGAAKPPGGRNVSKAILAKKYLVQFDDDNVATLDAVKASNETNPTKQHVSPPTPQQPHVGPTKVPLKCMKLATKEVMQCKITMRDERGVSILAAHQRLGECSEFVNPISELIVHPKYFYLISPATYGNLHSYVYSKSSLKETEAKSLFKQMVSIVDFCHSKGVILRDLKLGKFVFADRERTIVKLESLEDVVILEKANSKDDHLDDRHGCPNYVSPEKTECVIKSGSVKYSGKSSDVWALGISLYAMLAGRYPFNDINCSRLLEKIRHGCHTPIDGISPFAKAVVRCLLMKDPKDRPSCQEILNHPWFRTDYQNLTPVARAPVVRTYATSIRDMEGMERDFNAKRVKVSLDDDQVVPGS